MKIACLADLHLGYRGAGRMEGGRPVRQVDVERALAAAVDRIVEIQPDLVTIAGDVFDTVSPPLACVKEFVHQINRIVMMTRADVVIIGGNHETPRTAGVLSPNELASTRFGSHYHRVWVVTEPKVVRTGGAAVHCFPCSYLGRPGVVVPEPVPGLLNVLLIHAAVRSSARPDAVSKFYAGADAYDVARAKGFDVVVCGDFHEFRVLAPSFETYLSGEATGDNHDARMYHWAPADGPVAFYSGSIERTSSDIWSEHAPKGCVVVDTDARTLEFVEVPGRPMIDVSENATRNFPPDAGSVNETLDGLLRDEATADALVRLVVEDFPRSERDGIDYSLVRALQQRCVHFRLDIRHPEAERVEFTDRRERAPHTLEGDAALFFAADEPPVRAAAFDALELAIPQEVG